MREMQYSREEARMQGRGTLKRSKVRSGVDQLSGSRAQFGTEVFGHVEAETGHIDGVQ